MKQSFEVAVTRMSTYIANETTVLYTVSLISIVPVVSGTLLSLDFQVFKGDQRPRGTDPTGLDQSFG